MRFLAWWSQRDRVESEPAEAKVLVLERCDRERGGKRMDGGERREGGIWGEEAWRGKGRGSGGEIGVVDLLGLIGWKGSSSKESMERKRDQDEERSDKAGQLDSNPRV
jgi:hypothetical protein